MVSDPYLMFDVRCLKSDFGLLIADWNSERDFFRLKPATAGKLVVCRLHDKCPVLQSSRQTFYKHLLLKGIDYKVRSVADQT